MFTKVRLGILEPFQPYHSLQVALTYWTGEYVHPIIPWLLSYLNGSTAAGFAFARFYRRMPGDSGPMKGFVSGVLGWLAMYLIFFPLLGLGLFATKLWARSVARAVFPRDDADLQRRHGHGLQHDRRQT